jgi:hypothetical protein
MEGKIQNRLFTVFFEDLELKKIRQAPCCPLTGQRGACL